VAARGNKPWQPDPNYGLDAAPAQITRGGRVQPSMDSTIPKTRLARLKDEGAMLTAVLLTRAARESFSPYFRVVIFNRFA
jgi:hypothetical protein